MNDKGKTVMLPVGDGTTMAAYIAQPMGNGPFPGLVLFQEAFGVNEHIRTVAERFAAEGYVVIAPEIFHRTAPVGFTLRYDQFDLVKPHLDGITEAGLEADTHTAWIWLQMQSNVRKDAIACVGYCLGGKAAFLANSVRPFQAAVSYYGGRIAPGLLPRAASLHGPILFFWAGQDKHIPPEQVAQVMQAVRQAKHPHINVEISSAEHGFFCESRASYHPQAARESWALTLAFLREKLNIA